MGSQNQTRPEAEVAVREKQAVVRTPQRKVREFALGVSQKGWEPL